MPPRPQPRRKLPRSKWLVKMVGEQYVAYMPDNPEESETFNSYQEAVSFAIANRR
jgi:hypothetical protein